MYSNGQRNDKNSQKIQYETLENSDVVEKPRGFKN